MHPDVVWTATKNAHPARQAALASMDAVVRGAKADWLELFAPDAVIQDPVGKSPLDPEGNGHHGRPGIEGFWDNTISTAARLEFHIHESFAAGDEVANVGFIRTHLPDGSIMDAEGVFIYQVDGDGNLRSMRAFWEFERAMATLRQG